MADLWCVVIQGNDDTIPCASRAAAVRGATWTNLCLHKANMRHAQETTSPVLWASPAPWTGTPEAHAEGLAAENARDPRWANARTPLDQANAVVNLGNAMSDLVTWLPGYDLETGRLDEEDET